MSHTQFLLLLIYFISVKPIRTTGENHYCLLNCTFSLYSLSFCLSIPVSHVGHHIASWGVWGILVCLSYHLLSTSLLVLALMARWSWFVRFLLHIFPLFCSQWLFSLGASHNVQHTLKEKYLSSLPPTHTRDCSVWSLALFLFGSIFYTFSCNVTLH